MVEFPSASPAYSTLFLRAKAFQLDAIIIMYTAFVVNDESDRQSLEKEHVCLQVLSFRVAVVFPWYRFAEFYYGKAKSNY
jgi:hypothetical protein